MEVVDWPIKLHTLVNPLINAGAEGAVDFTVSERAALVEQLFVAVTLTLPVVKPELKVTRMEVSPGLITMFIPEVTDQL